MSKAAETKPQFSVLNHLQNTLSVVHSVFQY